MRNISTIICKQEFSTSGTCNKLRSVGSCLDFNANANISTMVMASHGLCGMKCIVHWKVLNLELRSYICGNCKSYVYPLHKLSYCWYNWMSKLVLHAYAEWIWSIARTAQSWIWLTSTLRWSLKPWWWRNLRKQRITLWISSWNTRTSDTYSYLTPSSIYLTTQQIDTISHYLFCNLWLIHCNWILCRFHWINLVIDLSTSRIYVMDSLRKPVEDWSDLANLLQR
jgi:hypothetical protein